MPLGWENRKASSCSVLRCAVQELLSDEQERKSSGKPQHGGEISKAPATTVPEAPRLNSRPRHAGHRSHRRPSASTHEQGAPSARCRLLEATAGDLCTSREVGVAQPSQLCVAMN